MKKVEVLSKNIVNNKFEVILYRKPNSKNEFDTNYYAVSVTDLKNDELVEKHFKKFNTIENFFEVGGVENDHALQKAQAYHYTVCQKLQTFIPKDGRKLEKGMLVGIHWNSHKDRYSVVKMKSRKSTHHVLGYVDAIDLKDVTFHIDKSKQKIVRTQNRKERHAFVVGYVERIGEFCEDWSIRDEFDGDIVYNPFKHDTFHCKCDVTQEISIRENVEHVYLGTDLDNEKPIVRYVDYATSLKFPPYDGDDIGEELEIPNDEK